MASTQAYYQTSSLPIAMPKGRDYYQTPVRNPYSVSPPEAADSITSGSNAYGNSGYSGTSSYAGSEYDSRNSANGVDLHEYVQDRFSQISLDPLPLDRSLATQAQASGKLNAKQREIAELQAKAQARLAKVRSRFDEGMRDAKDVKRDLEWTQKHVSNLKTKTSRKHSSEYKKARERYPSPEY